MIAKVLEKNSIKEFIKYFIVSVVSLICDTVIYLILGKFFGSYLLSAPIGYTAGLFVNYRLSIKWVFSYRKKLHYALEFIIFAIIGFFGMGVNEVFIYLGLFVFNFSPLVSKAIAAVFSFIVNFLGRKLILYTKWNHERFL